MKMALLLSFLFFLDSPQKNEGVSDQLFPTKLKITVIDGLGNIVEGATVAIYTEKEDYLKSINPVQTLSTDDKGQVTFKDVKPISYFVEVKKGEKNNNGEGAVTGKLSEKKINKVNVVIE